MFLKDQFMKKHFEKETCMSVLNEQDSQVPGSHWVIVYQNKKNTYFIDSFGRDFFHYDFNFKGPIYLPRIYKITMFRIEITWSFLVFFGCRLTRGLDMNSIMDYFTRDCRLNNEFICNYINEKL